MILPVGVRLFRDCSLPTGGRGAEDAGVCDVWEGFWDVDSAGGSVTDVMLRRAGTPRRGAALGGMVMVLLD